ncbi:MAG: type I-E CRISPR-associated protein Cse2/CasB [Promethearchaeota archaeon]
MSEIEELSENNNSNNNENEDDSGIKDRNVLEFINNLERLYEKDDRGALAYLRKGVRKTIGEAPRSAEVFYRVLPSYLIGDKYEEIYFTIATLFALNPNKSRKSQGNFGTTMKKLFHLNESESLKSRFIDLLNSNFELIGRYPGDGPLTYKLSQLVRMAKGAGVEINWAQLLHDLIYWEHDSKFVQKRWAQEFFSS